MAKIHCFPCKANRIYPISILNGEAPNDIQIIKEPMKIIKGYKVYVEYEICSDEEMKRKTEAIAKIVYDSMIRR